MQAGSMKAASVAGTGRRYVFALLVAVAKISAAPDSGVPRIAAVAEGPCDLVRPTPGWDSCHYWCQIDRIRVQVVTRYWTLMSAYDFSGDADSLRGRCSAAASPGTVVPNGGSHNLTLEYALPQAQHPGNIPCNASLHDAPMAGCPWLEALHRAHVVLHRGSHSVFTDDLRMNVYCCYTPHFSAVVTPALGVSIGSVAPVQVTATPDLPTDVTLLGLSLRFLAGDGSAISELEQQKTFSLVAAFTSTAYGYAALKIDSCIAIGEGFGDVKEIPIIKDGVSTTTDKSFVSDPVTSPSNPRRVTFSLKVLWKVRLEVRCEVVFCETAATCRQPSSRSRRAAGSDEANDSAAALRRTTVLSAALNIVPPRGQVVATAEPATGAGLSVTSVGEIATSVGETGATGGETATSVRETDTQGTTVGETATSGGEAATSGGETSSVPTEAVPLLPAIETHTTSGDGQTDLSEAALTEGQLVTLEFAYRDMEATGWRSSRLDACKASNNAQFAGNSVHGTVDTGQYVDTFLQDGCPVQKWAQEAGVGAPQATTSGARLSIKAFRFSHGGSRLFVRCLLLFCRRADEAACRPVTCSSDVAAAGGGGIRKRSVDVATAEVDREFEVLTAEEASRPSRGHEPSLTATHVLAAAGLLFAAMAAATLLCLWRQSQDRVGGGGRRSSCSSLSSAGSAASLYAARLPTTASTANAVLS